MAIYLLLVPVILFSLTLHEYMHGLTADRLGDKTPRLSGRLTLNPLSHLDPIGTLMLFVARFGWAKPVPINPFNFKDPIRDMAIVALAGPFSNLLFAIVAGLLIRLTFGSGPAIFYYYHSQNTIFLFLFLFMQINLALAFFNLLPIPPLDGSKILLHLLPPNYRAEYIRIQPLGPLFLMAIVLLDYLFNIDILKTLIWFPSNLISRLILNVALF